MFVCRVGANREHKLTVFIMFSFVLLILLLLLLFCFDSVLGMVSSGLWPNLGLDVGVGFGYW